MNLSAWRHDRLSKRSEPLDLAEEENRPCPVVASKDRPNGKEEKEVSFWDFVE